ERRFAPRKVRPVELDWRAGDLPMTGLRVFARRDLRGASGRSAIPIRNFETLWYATARGTAALADPERTKARHIERPCAHTGGIGCARGTAIGDVAERIAPFIAEGGSIRRAAAAERIQDDEDRAAHATCSSLAGARS